MEMFAAALFIKAPNGRCPAVHQIMDLTKKSWYMHTVKHSSPPLIRREYVLRPPSPQGMPKTTANTKPSYAVRLSYKFKPVHLNAALSGFSLAYLSCQHHYCCVQELLLGKVRVLEHKYCDFMTVDLFRHMAIK